ncbi:MAG: hypothetical protein ACNI27_07265 [Desulfovibrio sp.]
MATKTWLARGHIALNMMNGTQTQHRIPMNPQPRIGVDGKGRTIRDDYFVWDSPSKRICPVTEDAMYSIVRQAPYQIGDIVWVREPARVIAVEESEDCLYEWVRLKYAADNHEATITIPPRLYEAWDTKYTRGAPAWLWKKQGIPNGIFKEAARTFLRINEIRVERIRSISEADCIAEGIREHYAFTTLKEQFRNLWANLYSRSWSRNDWVWVYEFEQVDKPTEWDA